MSEHFRALLKRQGSFHALFGLLIGSEAIIGLLFCSPLAERFWLGVVLASLLVTVLLYCLLRLHMDEQLLQGCKALVQQGDLLQAAKSLEGCADDLYWKRFGPLLHWHEVLQMQELLIQAAIDARIAAVRRAPAHAQTHAALAMAYTELAALFVREPAGLWGPTHEELQARHRAACALAIEELQIVSGLAPHDPWAYQQLAAGYRALRMQEAAIAAYEQLADLQPSDDVLFQLGKLYFAHGQHAKGLAIYNRLHGPKAEQLLACYAHH